MPHARAKFLVPLLVAAFGVAGTVSAGELLPDPGFERAQLAGQWWATSNVRLDYRPGALCGEVEGGASQPWDAMIGLNGLSFDKGKNYRLSIEVSGEPGGPMRAVAQKAAEPWTAESEIVARLPAAPQHLNTRFTAQASHESHLVFQLGGSETAWRFCLRHASLLSGEDAAAASDVPSVPAIRVNQLAYFPDGPKRATLVTSGQTPGEWRLVSADGSVAASGRTVPFGPDTASDLDVQIIDFSQVTAPGEGYRLVAGGETSTPFSISGTAHAPLRDDALAYFYKVRSGVEIRGNLAGETYARPAGHAGQPPNRGDTSVDCLDAATARRIHGEAWSCDYRLDVAGGWYDAGDYGKYVVNGGIAASQLMGTYERALNYGGSSAALADGLAAIPEAGNGVPDLLDEARWELDFMLSMMVPEGEALAGMVHHKVHGARWPSGPIMPDRDAEPRFLHRPSTAATLNLSAAAAQGARLFAPFDKAYADRLLAASVRAYEAAEANPAVYAPYTDGSFGGGDYQDDDVSDEFYWAAAELYLTTGDPVWLDRAKTSPHWDGPVFAPEGFNWRSLAALARLDLASVPSNMPRAELGVIQASVLKAADRYLDIQSKEGFGLMLGSGSYGWGSNHSVIENMIVAANAYDISGERRYLQAARESMDYILGRNALGLSYVTGYGTDYAHRQFSFLFAGPVDPSFPPLPRGALAGGPNSGLADEVAISRLEGCAPQACYIDDPRSFSTNEIAINWNAPLVWIASFLTDAGRDATR